MGAGPAGLVYGGRVGPRAPGPQCLTFLVCAGVCQLPTCSIQRLSLDGSGQETWAYNIRNAAGLAFQPGSGLLWFNDMGRDGMGDNEPDDTLFSSPQPGLDYQFPYCHW